MQDDLAAEPGVKSVSLAEEPLMTDSNSSSTVRVEGYTPKDDEDMNPNFNTVGPGFFSTLGIPLLAGRDFGDADGPDAPQVAVVNEAFARYFFGDESPVGRRFGMGGGKSKEGFPIEIVGLVRDGKAASLREKSIRFVYVPYTQQKRRRRHDLLRALEPGGRGAWAGASAPWSARPTPACPSPT